MEAVPTDRCSICKGCYHEATGHYISPTMRWCGPCTRDFVDWIKRNFARRWGSMRFYDFIGPLPPGLNSV